MSKKSFIKKYKAFFLLLLFVIGWSVLLYFINPKEIVDRIGVHNGYLLGFLVSIFGGVSVVSSSVIYGTLITLVVGGVNFFILGIIIGVSASIGDMIMFVIGLNGASILESGSKKDLIKKYKKKFSKIPSPIVYIIIFLYTAFLPFPNEVILVPVGLAGYSYKKIFPFILLGNVAFMILLGYLALRGEDFLLKYLL